MEKSKEVKLCIVISKQKSLTYDKNIALTKADVMEVNASDLNLKVMQAKV